MSDMEMVNTNKRSAENLIYDCDRVDFYDPESIRGYGSRILDEIKRKIDNFVDSEVVNDEEEFDTSKQAEIKSLDISKRIAENDKIKEEEDKKIRTLNSNFIMKGINALFKIEDRMEHKSKTYGEIYHEYVEEADKLTEEVARKRDNNIISYAKTRDLIEQLEDDLSYLKRLIQVGREDKEDFINNVINEMKSNENIDETNIYSLKVLEKSVEMFEGVLIDLEECLEIQRSQNEQLRLSNINTMHLVSRQDALIRRHFSVIRGQGLLMTRSRRQTDEVNQMEFIGEVVNESMRNSSKSILSNAKRLCKLNRESFIKDATVKAVHSDIMECQRLNEESDRLYLENIKRRRDSLKLLSDDLKRTNSQNENKNNSEDNRFIQTTSHGYLLDDVGYQKLKRR